MAKLPDIQYLSATPGLGRQDIGLPGRMLTAQMALYGAVEGVVVDFAQQMADQEMGESVAGAQSEMSQLKTVLVQQRVVDVDRYDLTAGVDYKPQDVNGEPIKSISSHTVMDKVWRDGVKTIMGKYSEGMAPGQRRLMRQKLAGSVAKMGGSVQQQAFKWRNDEFNAKADQQVHTLRNSATFEIKDEVKAQISSTINDQVRSGTISAEVGVKKNRIERSKVDYHVTSQLITDGGREVLDQVEEMLARPPDQTGLELTLEQRRALYTQLDVRERRLESNREKVAKEEGERFVTNTLIDLRETGAKPWPDIRKLTRDMPAASARLVVTLNQLEMDAAEKETEEPDDTIYAGLQADVLAMSTGRSQGMAPQQSHDAFTNMVYHQVVNLSQGRPGITPEQARTLVASSYAALKSKQKPIGYQDARDRMSWMITRGSETNMGMNNNSVQVLKFYEAVRDLDTYIGGGGKDPVGWWEQEKENYAGAVTAKNMTKADIAVADRYYVPTAASNVEGAPPFNVTEALAKARADYDVGIITDRTYQMVVDYWRGKRATHMDLLKRRSERGQ